MTNEEVRRNLCYYDEGTPDCDPESDDAQKPRDGCYCDNCYYGRDVLAMEILKEVEA